ncbi:uncharacterized protein LOC111084436 [Limulus polyphemus]|uniref:Uncharacterized protein LOC111084436 n=1 Tax=Limulus polyphemus TaxID=6850 RepID=A0ABM1RZP6_LIMPO|nr:uncharacterized protein LOC111084436 [Limulus polyphemus]
MAHQDLGSFIDSEPTSSIQSKVIINHLSVDDNKKVAYQNGHSKLNSKSQRNGDVPHKEAILLDLNDDFNDSLNHAINTFSSIEETTELDSLEFENQQVQNNGKPFVRPFDSSQDSSLCSELSVDILRPPSTDSAEGLSDRGIADGEVEDRLQSFDINSEHRSTYENVASTAQNLLVHKQTSVQSGRMEESIIEKEIRLQKEREEMLARERQSISPSPINQVHVNNNIAVGVGLTQESQRKSERLSFSPLPLQQKSQSNYTNYTTESKIAMEIREFKEREEELRKLRERVHSFDINETSPSEEDNDISIETNHSDCSIKSGSSRGDNLSSERQSPLTNAVQSEQRRHYTPAISLDTLHGGQQYNLGFAFANRRKENIKVKPLSDNGTQETSVFKSMSESPVEKEIRLAKEREEALRRERILVSPTTEGNEEKESTKNSNAHNSSKSKSSIPTTFNGNTQKMLATSRIQKEIDEQTERELALRAGGQIQTISQERTDSKVTRLGDGDFSMKEDITLNSVEPQQHKNIITSIQRDDASNHVTSSPLLIPVQTCTVDSDNTLSLQLPAKVRGVVLDSVVPQPTKTPSSIMNGQETRIPSPSSSSNSSNAITPPGRRFVQNPAGNRGISMQRFIASRGKEVRAISSSNLKSTSNGYPTATFIRGSSSVQNINQTYSNFSTLAPVVVRRGNSEGKPPLTHRKSLPSTELKIQEELKELKEREEELRLQRARHLATSQPNLHTLVDDNDDQTESFDQDNSQIRKERSSSNPDLSENGIMENQAEIKAPTPNNHRRRSVLIAQWEQRIQESECCCELLSSLKVV